MLVLERKLIIFRVKEVHFADKPHDIKGCDRLCFHSCKDRFDVQGFTCTPCLTLVIDLTEDLDTVWKKIKPNCRNEINRAQREDIKISINEHYEEFYHIFKSFVSQKKGYGLPFGIGLPSLNTLKKCGTLFTTESQGEILGGHLYFQGETTLTLYLSASKRLEAEKEKATLIRRANRLMHWEAIKYAKTNGLLELDFGGMWPQEEADADTGKRNINQFKQSFGGKIVPVYDYEKVYSPIYRIAYNLLMRVTRVTP